MANIGVYPFVVDSPPTALQIFRTLIGDDDPEQIESTDFGLYLFLSDEGALALLGLNADSPRLAQAMHLEMLAASQVLLLKVYTQDDLSVNGAAIANSLRELAKQIRADVVNGVDSEGFDIVQTGDDRGFFNIPEGAALPVYWPATSPWRL